jgi:hypothetical protein
MRVRQEISALLLSASLMAARGSLLGQEPPPQETPPPATPTPAPVAEEPLPWRPPEGAIIINFPSVDTPPPQTLQLHFTHRFSDPVQGSTIHNLFSFDSGAEVGIGLSYTPIKDLEVGFLRERTLEDYEVFAKYALPTGDFPVKVAVRAGGDFRTASSYPDVSSFFVQATVGAFLFNRVRLSVIPTFSTRAAGQRFVLPIEQNVFNVLFAASASITRTVNVQAEMVPRRNEGPGTGWIVAVEKTLVKHRFAFTAGNMKATTVDQYIRPDFNGLPVSNIYVGFNIIRQWKL